MVSLGLVVLGAGLAGTGFGDTLDNPVVGVVGVLLIIAGIAWLFRGKKA